MNTEWAFCVVIEVVINGTPLSMRPIRVLLWTHIVTIKVTISIIMKKLRNVSENP